MAYDGEEGIFLGSYYYVTHPIVPLDKTVAMLNLDMVGRLQDEKLIVHGTGTATEFDALVDRLGKQFHFKVTLSLAPKPYSFQPIPLGGGLPSFHVPTPFVRPTALT